MENLPHSAKISRDLLVVFFFSVISYKTNGQIGFSCSLSDSMMLMLVFRRSSPAGLTPDKRGRSSCTHTVGVLGGNKPGSAYAGDFSKGFIGLFWGFRGCLNGFLFFLLFFALLRGL